jgi:hypothetical protein
MTVPAPETPEGMATGVASAIKNVGGALHESARTRTTAKTASTAKQTAAAAI